MSGESNADTSRSESLSDARTFLILGVAAGCLWVARFGQDLASPSWTRLTELCWWATTQIVAYGIVPLIVVVGMGWTPQDLGCRWRGIGGHWRIYGGLFVVAVPFVVLASRTAVFQDQYPLLDVAPGGDGPWRDLARWWPFYALQFVAIEVFFRGFLVLGLARRFGSMAVVISVVPYMMIHFVKPPAEALASIVGGLVLGLLALRTGSIIGGVALHLGVAALMDVIALGHQGFIW